MKIVGVAALLFLAVVSLRAQQARTAKDGVFTDAQAARGKAIFNMRCALCHGERLEGAAGPPLGGQEFLGPRDGQPLPDVFEKINATMPADAPGTLEPQQVADVVAFILQANQFPAGRTELASTAAPLDHTAAAAARTSATLANAPAPPTF